MSAAWRWTPWPVLLLLLGGMACGCHRPVAAVASLEEFTGSGWFEDITDTSNISFCHDPGPVSGHRLPQIMGSGCALLDFDNDGRLDVYLLHNAGPDSASRNTLFRQQADGTFENVSSGSGVDFAGYSMGVAVGDFDNDGWVDLYVSQYSGGRLFRNRGVLGNRWRGFEEVTASAGVDQPCWGTSCAFFDYDRDGWLDLIVVNYVDYDPSRQCRDASGKPDYCHPSVFPGTTARLYRNLGRTANGSWGGFADVTVQAGLSRPGPGLGVVCLDFNGDGWPDILVANDAQANYLWINQKNGTFREEGRKRGLATGLLGRPQADMGIAIGDVDGDGNIDVFITHLTEETHTLWRQDPPGLFRDETASAGLATPRWRGTGFGTVLADFDLDGWLDLAIVNGRVTRGAASDTEYLDPFWRLYAERNQLFRNQGRGRFLDVSLDNASFCRTFALGRGLAWGDVDNDGTVDLLVTNVAGPARLFRNVAQRQGRWLMVRAIDPTLKRDAYGARITVRAGSRRWVAEVCPAQSYLSSCDPRVHFGLGNLSAIDELHVAWPDGLHEAFTVPRLDQQLTLQRGQGKKLLP